MSSKTSACRPSKGTQGILFVAETYIDNPVFLKTYTEAGHGGMAGRYNQIKETAFIYAFILWRNNLIKRPFSS